MNPIKMFVLFLACAVLVSVVLLTVWPVAVMATIAAIYRVVRYLSDSYDKVIR